MALLMLHRSGMANATPAIPFPPPISWILSLSEAGLVVPQTGTYPTSANSFQALYEEHEWPSVDTFICFKY